MNFEKLSMRNQLMSMFLFVSFLTMLINIVITEWQASNGIDAMMETADSILIEEEKHKLSAIEELQLHRVQDYFQGMQEQIDLFRQDNVSIEMMEDFINASNKLVQENASAGIKQENLKKDLWGFYEVSFDYEYEKVNGISFVDLKEKFSRLSPKAIALQNEYLLKNIYALNEKSKLLDSGSKITYNKFHIHHHEHISKFIETFNFNDVYFVSASTGEVVYNYSKNLVLGTSLKSGAFAKSHLGECYRAVIGSTSNPEVKVFIDFEKFSPILDRPAAFIGAPVYQDGKVTGVFVFELAIDFINQLMTERSGLGETGEIYLVGSDRLPRNNLFYLKEKSVLDSFLNASNSKLNLDSVDKALNGEKGSYETKNYMGVPTLTSYSPIDVMGQRWAIITEIHRDEIYRPLHHMNAEFKERKLWVLIIGMVTGAMSLVLMFFAAKFLIGVLEKPIRRVAASCGIIAQSARKMSGELAQVSSSNIQMGSVIREIASSSENTSRSASRTVQIAKSSEVSILSLGEEANKISEVLEAIQGIAEKTDLLALNATIEAATAGEAGKGFSVVATEVQQLANKTAEAAENITEKILHIQEQLKVNIQQTQEVAEANQEIEEATASLASAIEEMSLTIDNVNSSTNSTSDLTSDVTTEILEVREEMGEILHGRK